MAIIELGLGVVKSVTQTRSEAYGLRCHDSLAYVAPILMAIFRYIDSNSPDNPQCHIFMLIFPTQLPNLVQYLVCKFYAKPFQISFM